ncbi:glyoxalase family protein [Trichomonas vaginalis G3]|uniref:Glyoxalase family protein n=1 Tax=Trichomonas vaginalis (strain ATCC PRA-98 / G3) TaxID=412133 RepID=A2EFT0_TRIV3|nr:glyoxalase [Trichomonas vaginalis G3]EAY08481.1 glyoxalase family protein [Trichomonas vaginalis G3]KAI5537762.1 lyase-related-related family [Trichomonas vaginalis G3]|eukprot:XP_001320704.1 glyoxalase [Trichomonas vaginalis G3]
MKIDHIGVYVKDLIASRDFYVKYFNATSNDGYHNPKTGFRSYFVTLENGSRIELMNRAESVDRNDIGDDIGFVSFAIKISDPERKKQIAANLSNDGFNVENTGDNTIVYDPNGYKIELIC